MIKIFNDIPRTDRKAYFNILIAVLLTVFYQTYHTYYSNIMGIILSIVIIVFGLRGWIIYYRSHKLHSWGKAFVTLIIYFLIVGFLHGGGLNNNIIGLMLSQDIRYVMFFLIGGMFAFDDNMKSYHQIMRILGIISIIFGVLALFTFNPSIQSIDTREGTWSISYYYWWCSSACFYYWGYYALFIKKENIIGYGVMIAYVLLGLLFLKRSVIVDFGVMLLFYALFAPKKGSFLKPVIFILIATAVLMLVKGSFMTAIYNFMMGRFEVSLEEFDRALEADSYFNIASLTDIIWGNGIGHYYSNTGIRDTEGVLNALHLGWANIIYKGGIIYIIFNVIMYGSVLKRVFHLPKDNYSRGCLGIAISSLISMFYAGGWSYTILPFCISAPIFYIATHYTNPSCLQKTWE